MCLAAVIVGMLISALISLVVLIGEAKFKYRYKHRFDKPPTAKCYCIDCRYHDNKDGLCSSLNYCYTADNWFCYNADPRKKEK